MHGSYKKMILPLLCQVQVVTEELLDASELKKEKKKKKEGSGLAKI